MTNLDQMRGRIARKTSMIQLFSHWVLVVGTIAAIAPAAYNGALDRLPAGLDTDVRLLIANIVAAGLALIIARAVDGGLKDFLPFVVARFMGKKDVDTAAETMKGFDYITAALCLIMLAATVYMNYTINPEVVDLATGDANTEMYENQLEREQDRYYTTLQAKQGAVDQARAEWNEAKANKTTIESDYIAGQINRKVAELYVSGNGWVRSEYEKTIKAAQRYAANVIASAESEYQQAKANLENYEATQGTAAASIVGVVSQKIESETMSHEVRKGRFLSVFNVMLLAAFFLFVGSTYLRVKYQIVTGEDLDQDLTLGNIGKGVAKKARVGFLSSIVKAFGLRKDDFTATPTLAFVGTSVASQKTLTPVLTKPASQKSESQKPKSECKSGKCKPSQRTDSDPPESESQKVRSQSQNVEPERSNLASESEPERGVGEWPTPEDQAGWKKLLTRARGWSEQAALKAGTETGERNMGRWNEFVDYAAGWGYSCSRSETTGKACITLGVSDDSEEAVTMAWNVNGEYN